jgi:endonuclease G
MLRITFLYLLASQFYCLAQAPHKADTVRNSLYTSLYCPEDGEPALVCYKLYHGGGDCSRKSFRFKDDKQVKLTASKKDYAKTGYDQGHLANAEDFAFDCIKEEQTFRYYNCVPQTTILNRGIWKTWETKIRENSQNDSLLILCGAVLHETGLKKVKPKSKLTVPHKCWKVVQSLSTKEVLYVMVFTQEGTMNSISIVELESVLGFAVRGWLKK